MDEIRMQIRDDFELRNLGDSSAGPEEWLWLWLGVGLGRGFPAIWGGLAGSVKIKHNGPALRSQRQTIVQLMVCLLGGSPAFLFGLGVRRVGICALGCPGTSSWAVGTAPPAF